MNNSRLGCRFYTQIGHKGMLKVEQLSGGHSACTERHVLEENYRRIEQEGTITFVYIDPTTECPYCPYYQMSQRK